MIRHPRCAFDAPHRAHDFVTYVEPLDVTHYGPEPSRPRPPHLQQLWCPGEPEPPAACDCGPDADPVRRLTHQPWCPVWGL